MGLRTLPAATTACHTVYTRGSRDGSCFGVALGDFGWGRSGIDTQPKRDRRRKTNAGKRVDTTEEQLTDLCSSYCCGVPAVVRPHRC